jgi:hypothetical protein
MLGKMRMWMAGMDDSREKNCGVIRGLMKRLQMESVEALTLDS